MMSPNSNRRGKYTAAARGKKKTRQLPRTNSKLCDGNWTEAGEELVRVRRHIQEVKTALTDLLRLAKLSRAE